MNTELGFCFFILLKTSLSEKTKSIKPNENLHHDMLYRNRERNRTKRRRTRVVVNTVKKTPHTGSLLLAPSEPSKPEEYKKACDWVALFGQWSPCSCKSNFNG